MIAFDPINYQMVAIYMDSNRRRDLFAFPRQQRHGSDMAECLYQFVYITLCLSN